MVVAAVVIEAVGFGVTAGSLLVPIDCNEFVEINVLKTFLPTDLRAFLVVGTLVVEVVVVVVVERVVLREVLRVVGREVVLRVVGGGVLVVVEIVVVVVVVASVVVLVVVALVVVLVLGRIVVDKVVVGMLVVDVVVLVEVVVSMVGGTVSVSSGSRVVSDLTAAVVDGCEGSPRSSSRSSESSLEIINGCLVVFLAFFAFFRGLFSDTKMASGLSSRARLSSSLNPHPHPIVHIAL